MRMGRSSATDHFNSGGSERGSCLFEALQTEQKPIKAREVAGYFLPLRRVAVVVATVSRMGAAISRAQRLGSDTRAAK